MAAPGALSAIAQGGFVAIDLSAESAAHPTWRQPVRAFFRRSNAGWKLVGFERLPGAPGVMPATTPAAKPASKAAR